MDETCDAIVLGAGRNGLILQTCLARAVWGDGPVRKARYPSSGPAMA